MAAAAAKSMQQRTAAVSSGGSTNPYVNQEREKQRRMLGDAADTLGVKEIATDFFLEERDMKGYPSHKRRNFSGMSMFITTWARDDCLSAAHKRWGGEQGFAAKLAKQAKLWKAEECDEVPQTRYFLHRTTRKNVQTAGRSFFPEPTVAARARQRWLKPRPSLQSWPRI